MVIHPVRFGLAIGFAHAVFLVIIGILAGLFGYGMEIVRIFRSIYPGYNVTLVGIGLGTLWGLFAGFATGWLFSVIFNFFSYLDHSSDYE